MVALRLMGTLLWVGLMLLFGFLAVGTGEGVFWAISAGCVIAFSAQVYAMQRRDDRAAVRAR